MVSIQTLNFYGWWQLIVCGFAFAGLFSIWYHLGRKQQDIGQVYLALSILCWSFSGGVEVYYSQGVESLTDIQSVQLNGFRSIFSLLNSLLILLALPWFRHQPKWLRPLTQERYWPLMVGLPFLFCLLPTLNKMMSGQSMKFVSEPDVYYAFMTLFLLANVLWESFINRGLKLLAYLSLLFILLTLAAQLYKFTDNVINLVLLSAIFKTLLIMLFFALALSWVKAISESLQLDPALVSIWMTTPEVSLPGKRHRIQIQGVKNNSKEVINLTPAMHQLLQSFVVCKLNDPAGGWLEIKPKGMDTRRKAYAINDYNEIKRLIQSILDGLFGKDRWVRDRHEKPLKEALFEFDQDKGRRIRLRIPVSQLHIEEV